MGDKRSVTVTTDIEDYEFPDWSSKDHIVLHALANMFVLPLSKRLAQKAQFDAWASEGPMDNPQPPKAGYPW